MVTAKALQNRPGMLGVWPTRNPTPRMDATASQQSPPPQSFNNTLWERNQIALSTYPKELRGVMLPLGPGITLEPYHWDESDEPLTISQRLTATPRKRKKKKPYEPEPFQKKRNKKGKEKEHTPLAIEEEDDDEELPPWNDPIAMKLYVETQQQRLKDLRNQSNEVSQTPAAPRTPQKGGRGRRPNQSVKVGSRLTEEDDIIIVSLALKYQASYGITSMTAFWKRVRNKFERITKRTYASVERRTKVLIEMRQQQLKQEAKAGHGHEARDDMWTKAIDDWNDVIEAYQQKKHTSKAAKEKKAQDSKDHDRMRQSLNERMGNKKRKVLIEIASDVSNETNSDENNTQEGSADSSTDDESSNDDIPDDLATPLAINSVRSVESVGDSPTPGPSKSGPSDPYLDALLVGISSHSDTPVPPPRNVKKTKKTPKKQYRQRKDRPTAATEGTAELQATMARYIEYLMNQPPAATSKTITTDTEGSQAKTIRHISKQISIVTENQRKYWSRLRDIDDNLDAIKDHTRHSQNNQVLLNENMDVLENRIVKRLQDTLNQHNKQSDTSKTAEGDEEVR